MFVVGSGYIAKAFARANNPGFSVYARGVSNTRQYSNQDFDQDLDALKRYLQKNDVEKLIYISSSDLSEYQPFSRYLEHKARLEDLVRSYSNTIILRLPQVINSDNTRSLVSWLKYSIQNNLPINAWVGHKRYPLAFSDIQIFNDYIGAFPIGSVVDARPKFGLTTREIVDILKPGYPNIIDLEFPVHPSLNEGPIYLFEHSKKLNDSSYCAHTIRQAL